MTSLPFEHADGLYPNILFHFTSQAGLFKILADTFKVSYSRERILISGHQDRSFAIPIVSFCDLRLTELKTHMKSYGRYGIGLRKSWALRAGLNPVWYINGQSPVPYELFMGLDRLFKLLDALEDAAQLAQLSRAYGHVLNVVRCMKNYQGPLSRRGKLINPSYRFADEREWRYIPDVPLEQMYVPAASIETASQKSRYNKRLEHLRLRFKPDDIKYLIVDSDADIAPLLAHLQAVKVAFDTDTLNRLGTRILTAEQICEDV